MARVASREQLLRVFTRLHSRLLVRTRGRPSRLTTRLRCLVLETSGRHTGRKRRVVLAFLPAGDDFVVLGSNFGSDLPPDWLLNLQACPDAVVHIGGRTTAVQARELKEAERQAMLVRASRCNRQWRTYAATMDRKLPVVVLSRR